jgi:hypothetical protein
VITAIHLFLFVDSLFEEYQEQEERKNKKPCGEAPKRRNGNEKNPFHKRE